MTITIAFERRTVKTLWQELHAALRRGDRPRCQRLAALVLLADGHTPATVAERLAIGRSTVYTWLQAFLVDRWASVRPGNPPGRPAKLTPSQKQQLCALVTAGPEAAGYTTGCWTSAVLQDLIQREFGVLYNVHYLSELLRNLGFSYQKARFVSEHLDEVRRQRWRTVDWPALLQTARQRGALLLFGDEASFAQWGSLACTWAPRGQQPVVKTGGKRKGYKVFGLIDYFTGRLFYRGHTERFTAASYCAFLQTVLATTHQPILLIQDGARYHTAAQTQAFFAAHRERLTVHQLPSYSPDFNPIEHLWRNVKRHSTHNRYFPDFSDLTAAVETALTYFQQQAGEVKQLMGSYLDDMAEFALAA